MAKNRLAYQLGPPPTWTQPSVVKGREQGKAKVVEPAVRNALAWLSQMLGAEDPQAQVMGLMGTSVASAGPLGGLLGKATKAIKAYHGSPHDFDKFSTANIGTGEGAQAYGHGLYFAENKAVAQQYRDDLSRPVLKLRGEPFPDSVHGKNFLQLTDDQTVDEAARDFLRTARAGTQGNATLDDIIVYATGQARVMAHHDPAQRVHWLAAEQRIKDMAGDLRVSDGKMYEVNIKADPDDFLDWDAPLSQQSDRTQQAVLGPNGLNEFIDPQTMTGADAYRRLGQRVGTNAGMLPEWARAEPNRVAASNALRQAGIPGIKYLDQGSRAAGQGSRNYVVFDDATIEIMKKYGLLPPAIAGLSHEAIRAHLKQQTGAD